MHNDTKDFKRVKEIALLLRVNPVTVYGYIRAGEITAIKIGRTYRIEWGEFLKFINKNKKKKI